MSGGDAPEPRGLSAPLSVVVLAGGAARRMGGEKASEPVGRRSLLERSLRVAHALSDDVLLAAAERPYAAADARRVPDWPGDIGPLGGVGAALEAARHDWLLLLACDQPWPSPDVAARLLDAAREANTLGAVVRGGSRLQPFPGLISRAALPGLRAHLAGGGRSLTGWLIDAVEPVFLGLDALAPADRGGAFLMDVDTPDDLTRARQLAATCEGADPCGPPR